MSVTKKRQAMNLPVKDPTRERRKPRYLKDSVTNNNTDEIHTSIDYCYRAVCGVSNTFKEAVESAHSKQWMKKSSH